VKKVLLLLFALATVHAQTAPSASADAGVVRYTIVLAGNKAGFETSKRNPDGSLELYYEFNDRGRGPKITEHVVLDGNQIPSRIESTGNDYEKAPVDERFSVEGGNATWKNRAEQGSKPVSDKAFYVSISGVPEEGGLLARALLAAGGKLRLLPEGEASIQKRGELRVEANGQSRTVTQYAVSGLDFVPDPVWLDQDGNCFAVVQGWFVVVREGWESSVDALNKAQDEIANRRAAELAGILAHKPSAALAFVHANLFDSEAAQVRPHTTVVISGNKIVDVGDDGKVQASINSGPCKAGSTRAQKLVRAF
jgi:hypothetical protein